MLSAVTWRLWPLITNPHAGDHRRLLWWLPGWFGLLYVLVPFLQAQGPSKRWSLPYRPIFEHSWNNFFIGLVGALFTGTLWSVIWVWGVLFNLIGISFFADLFFSRPFAYLFTSVGFGYGLALGRASAAVIGTLRGITFPIARALLPVIAGVALLFLAALPVTGLEPLWATGWATPLVLTLLGLLLLAFNAVFEDGSRDLPYPEWLRLAIGAAIVAMPAYAAIAAYSTSLRVRQYGLTPDRVFAVLFVGIFCFYSLGYALAALWRRGGWLGLIKPVNLAAAGRLIAALALLVQLPPLDPLRLSANNQFARLVRGEVAVDQFDFGALAYRLGGYGWEKLVQLERLENHPQAREIRQKVQEIREPWIRGAVARSSPQSPTLGPLRLIPSDLAVPAGLLDYATSEDESVARDCQRPHACLLIGADFDSDGSAEYCLVLRWAHSHCYSRGPAETWTDIGQLAFRGAGSFTTTEEIAETLGSAGLILRSPRYKALEVGRGVLELSPAGSAP